MKFSLKILNINIRITYCSRWYRIKKKCLTDFLSINFHYILIIIRKKD